MSIKFTSIIDRGLFSNHYARCVIDSEEGFTSDGHLISINPHYRGVLKVATDKVLGIKTNTYRAKEGQEYQPLSDSEVEYYLNLVVVGVVSDFLYNVKRSM